MKQLNRTQNEQNLVHSAITQIRKQYQNEQTEEVPKEIMENKYFTEYEQLNELELLTNKHIKYCTKKLLNIGYSIFYLDVGQPWCIYWPLNALSILQDDVSKYENQIIQYLEKCKIGGFTGGPNQFEHLAPTYSSLLSLFILSTPAALGLIDRQALEKFFWSVQDPTEKGSYLMHVNGEADIRAVYIVVIMVVILKLDPKLLDGCAEYIASCQTYEGGIGGVRYSEAHGGYTFCGYAALVCMKKADYIDQEKLMNWLVNRQMENEGGFNGRTNKVVDACYSFWQGAIFKLLIQSGYVDEQLMNVFELKNYIHMCQNASGGIFDKPSKSPDAYHTCYGLSGYSLADSNFQNPIYNIPNKCIEFVQNFFQ
ncbi:unnamed protein product (macronuclear) [Paramecium tetraurelia]|uniref:Prenyltransferase alpha-alpha toroid domain-containing protein n=1 Tax=Paramecium tetraurelia TaxID=5888 RepID=A0BHG1_PARTE|nr:uncharacterized protein GSPATT00029013001 [Paramecium tetraurelia]CAK57978.1 unnamed protein product [Paramecium tetraurelia]|eukprot:XP_001425376.1 hypothetical protein (macronuclear) [Paramecium tetraurelia strain d4-2]